MLSWYLESGKENDVIISTRVRIARNIKGFPYKLKQSKEDEKALLSKIKEITPQIGYGLKFLELKDIDDLTKMTLVEKHLISPEFAMDDKRQTAILLNDEENICIMINEEDHIRLQVFSSGLAIEEAKNLAIEIENKIGKLLPYDYSEKYGFITSCPTNFGTGMRISIMAQLTALDKTGNIRKVLEVVQNLGMNIRGIYGEGSKTSANIYQISNKQTLGISEEQLAKNIKQITEKIIEQERLARKLLGKNELELEDKVYRAYGILKYCRKISSSECEKILADVKLGTDFGILNELNDAKIKKMQLYTKPANLQKFIGKKQDAYERDISRANVIKQIIDE